MIYLPLLFFLASAEAQIFGPPLYHVSPSPTGMALAAADLNGDGRPDMIAPNALPHFGPANFSLAYQSLDDTGQILSPSHRSPPALGPFSFGGTVQTAAADFDGDGDIDLVSLTQQNGLTLYPNDRHADRFNGFQTAQLIDSFLPFPFPFAPHAPILRTGDFDQDGNQDIMASVFIYDAFFSGTVDPYVLFWFGRGDGTFVRQTERLQGAAVIDLQWIDWDQDGQKETFVFLTQTYQTPYFVTNAVSRYRLAGQGGRDLTPIGQPDLVILNDEYPTGIGFIPRSGTRPAQYLLTGWSLSGTTMSSRLWSVDLTSTGSFNRQGLIPLSLPAGVDLTESEFQGLKIADFNGDGQMDAVMLQMRPYFQGARLDPQIVFALGPFDSFGNASGFSTIPLTGSIATAPNQPSWITTVPPLRAWRPVYTHPDLLKIVDFNLDQLPDVLVAGVRRLDPNPNLGWLSAVVAVQNQSLVSGWQHGGATSVAPARLSPRGDAARCGLTGYPVLGNPDLKVSAVNLPKDALMSLHAGFAYFPFTFPGGLPMGTVPEVRSHLSWVHGTDEGRSRAEHDMAVPMVTALLGTEVYFQWMIYNPASNDPYPIYCTDTLRVQIGEQR